MAARRVSVVLPPSLDSWLGREVESSKFGSPAEYIRHLLRLAQAEWTVDSIDKKIAAGDNSGPAEPMTRRDWDAIRKRGDARVEKIRASHATSKRRKSA